MATTAYMTRYGRPVLPVERYDDKEAKPLDDFDEAPAGGNYGNYGGYTQGAGGVPNYGEQDSMEGDSMDESGDSSSGGSDEDTYDDAEAPGFVAPDNEPVEGNSSDESSGESSGDSSGDDAEAPVMEAIEEYDGSDSGDSGDDSE